MYVLAVHTGHKSKIMLNSVQSKGKKSTLEKKSIFIVFFCLGLMIALSAIATIQYLYSVHRYKMYETSKSLYIIIARTFGNWLLLLGNFIPISLTITVELIKFF